MSNVSNNQIMGGKVKASILAIYLDKELKADLEKLAKRKYTSMSSVVVGLIVEAVEKAKREGDIQ
ncbi:MAG: hypothetical protein ACRDB1_02300 [Microcoleaceae cyanobacterium]